MKYMGIDFGTKRVGIALSDSDGVLAKPHSVLKNDTELLDSVETLAQKEEVGGFVIGKSEGNAIQQDIDEFIAQLSLTTMLPVETMNESFSSVIAHGSLGKESLHARKGKIKKGGELDAKAAAVILQRYLDTKK